MRWYLLVVLISAVVTWLFCFPARKMGIMAIKSTNAHVRDRDVNDVPIPRLGGIAMFFGMIFALFSSYFIPFFGKIFNGDDSSVHEINALIFSSLLLALIGIIDDIWDVDWVLKLVVQIIAAVNISMNGVQLMSLPFNGMVIGSNRVSQVLTVIIVVAVINAINFIDGLDGLAAGVTAIGAVAFFYYAWRLSSGQYNFAATACLVTAVLIGACLGFLPHNWHPAKMFMGDTGSQLLGFYMASASILITGKIDPETVNIHSVPAFMPIILPFLVLLLPVFDITFAVVRRLLAGKSPFAPDRKHLHHRILDLGHSHTGSVLILYGWAALFAFGGIMFVFMRGRVALIILIIAAIVVFIATAAPKIFVKPAFSEIEKIRKIEHEMSEKKNKVKEDQDEPR
ncbi:MAG: undecaprenyl/decaprenyl-phosphate alpha-N-acetylglucosaminyl 1-phosphate transferase [Candidatus Ancillula sp.]|jgi:UDP-GlcNAc:undecaprenyl-phosphate GlcNAc-1-phosphate transferase|nr:undecaprenyl/decaprenyl-phosphate alpha-N-acetylglucosaminyl 1-phosphate transferase [Candidatus Ancillula sp.]